jgi:hypothetical protein
MRSARGARGQAAAGDEDDVGLASTECEMVLAKDEFDMLQAFHRLVPLPALTSRILRVYCEDDLQVPEASPDDGDGDSEAAEPAAAHSRSSATDGILRHPRRPSNLRKKPHFHINLASHTPRIPQQRQPPSPRDPSSSRSRADSEGSERPETQG